MKWSSKKKQPIQVLKIAKSEWTQEDTALLKQFASTTTFHKLDSLLNGYLVANILQGAGDGFRCGFLACLANIINVANAEPELEDSEHLTSMQHFYDDDTAPDNDYE